MQPVYTDEQGFKGQSMLVHGNPGVGKTSLIKTLLPQECLLICMDAGDMILRDLHCQMFKINQGELSKFKDLVKYLRSIKPPWKYIFIDNVTELEKFFLMGLSDLKRGGQPPYQQDWGDSAFWVRKYVRDLRDLTHEGVNIIFIFWSMPLKIEDKGGAIKSLIVPQCMKTLTFELCGLVDHVAYMGLSDKGSRYLQFEADDLILAKKRDLPGRELKKFEEADLGAVFKRLEGK